MQYLPSVSHFDRHHVQHKLKMESRLTKEEPSNLSIPGSMNGLAITSVGRRLLVRARGISSLVPVDLMRKVIRFL